MESPTPGGGRPRSYGGGDERRRVPIPRRQTKGPLDDDDSPPPPPAKDVASPDGLSATPRSQHVAHPLDSPAVRSPSFRETRPPARTQISTSASSALIDLSFLLRPQLYRPTSTSLVPRPFLQSHHQPAPDTSLEDLLRRGHFRHAADAAAVQLTSGELEASDITNILQLYDTRLRCLLLISQPDLAAQEARPLIDWLARNTTALRPGEQQTDAQLIPWELRLLLHRIQSYSLDDGRRAIMALYALAAECRASAQRAASAGNRDEDSVWQRQLADIGLRVAGELIEMGEAETALRHLDSLDTYAANDVECKNMAARKALLYIRVGDIAAAEQCIAKSSSDSEQTPERAILPALVALADSDYNLAVERLSALHAAHPDNEMVTQNLAVALLYTGKSVEAAKLLQSLVDDGQNFPTLLFNLATVYELQSEKAMAKKMQLAEKIADMGPSAGHAEQGWERMIGDFKL